MFILQKIIDLINRDDVEKQLNESYNLWLQDSQRAITALTKFGTDYYNQHEQIMIDELVDKLTNSSRIIYDLNQWNCSTKDTKTIVPKLYLHPDYLKNNIKRNMIKNKTQFTFYPNSYTVPENVKLQPIIINTYPDRFVTTIQMQLNELLWVEYDQINNNDNQLQLAEQLITTHIEFDDLQTYLTKNGFNKQNIQQLSKNKNTVLIKKRFWCDYFCVDDEY